MTDWQAHFPAEPRFELMLGSVGAGLTPAETFPLGDGLLVLDNCGHLYLSGNPTDERISALAAFVAGQVRRGRRLLEAIPASPAWESALPRAFPGWQLDGAERILHVLEQPLIPEWRERVPEGFRIGPIDAELTCTVCIENNDYLTDEISLMWGSEDAFHDHGFGVHARTGDVIACWCTAEYLSRGRCGIGIETAAEFQGRGLATLAAAAFIEEAQRRGLTPYWDCWADNPASRRVAAKAGFVETERYRTVMARR